MASSHLAHAADPTCTPSSKRESLWVGMLIYRGLDEGFPGHCCGNEGSTTFQLPGAIQPTCNYICELVFYSQGYQSLSGSTTNSKRSQWQGVARFMPFDKREREKEIGSTRKKWETKGSKKEKDIRWYMCLMFTWPKVIVSLATKLFPRCFSKVLLMWWAVHVQWPWGENDNQPN